MHSRLAEGMRGRVKVAAEEPWNRVSQLGKGHDKADFVELVSRRTQGIQDPVGSRGPTWW